MEDSKEHSRIFWKQSISFVRFHTGNQRHLARDGWASMFIGPEPVLDIFSVMCNLEVGGLIFDHNTKGYFSPGSVKLNLAVIRKTCP